MSQAGLRVHVFPTPQALAEEGARLVRHAGQGAVADHGRFALALSGGQTPLALYQLLAAAGPDALPYDRMEIFWSDERAVPPDDPASNYRLAWGAWLAHAPLEAHRVHRIRGEDDPESAAAACEAEVRQVLGNPPRFDLILLGVGRDGHTASLFPHDAALSSPRLVAPAASPLPPRQRITFTLGLLAAAAQILVLATGGDKAEAVRRALEEPASPAVPASLLRGPQALWYLDASAAAGLQHRAAFD